VSRAQQVFFPVLTAVILAAAAYAGQVSAGLILIAAVVLLAQARDFAPPDLLPGYRLAHWRRAAADIDLVTALEYFASAKPEGGPGPRTAAVAAACQAELDAYQAALPRYASWDWS
jgi:hypothetical protein